jgi:hypothetical protein
LTQTPARCNEKIANSTNAPALAIPLGRGGYTVDPVPSPLANILLVRRRDKEGDNNENFMLFVCGNVISGAPSINGTNQFPNPPQL